MSAGKKVWYMEAPRQWREFASVGEAARELSLVYNALGKALSRKKYNYNEQIIYKGMRFLINDPYAVPTITGKKHVAGLPLISNPITHRLGAWK